MNTTSLVATAIAGILFPVIARATEPTLTLPFKVRNSDVVAVVEVTALKRGDRNKSGYYTAEFKFATTKLIKGNCPKEVELSVRAIEAMAGFTALGIEQGERFIAYFKREADGSLTLSGDSNQYLEEIDPKTAMVSDIGQTTNQVPLAEKLAELRNLIIRPETPTGPNKAQK